VQTVSDNIVVPPKVPQFRPNEAYEAYRVEPTEQNFSKVMKSLDPVINRTLVSMGQSDNPMLKDQARIFAARAVKKFKPDAGAQLHTWVSGQLIQLRRTKREFNSPLKVPERIQLDAYHLDKKTREFVDLHNREPDVAELADFAHMPVKRITKVRQQYLRVPTTESISDDTRTDSETDYMLEAVGYLYHDADKLDRKILEHRTGYGGAEILSNSQLSKLLHVRPDVISKRSAKLGTKLSEVGEKLKRAYE
jgi:hypothetical protein